MVSGAPAWAMSKPAYQDMGIAGPPTWAQGYSNHSSQPQKKIYFYERHKPYYGFSQFSKHPVTFGKHTYKTAEALYQSRKFPPHLWPLFVDKSGREAYKLARELPRNQRRDDWHNINVKVMRAVVALKVAQHPSIRELLLGTGDAKIIEDSPSDPFYGRGADGRGRNELGKIWMQQRERLRAERGRDIVLDLGLL